MLHSREIRLRSRPAGMPSLDNFELASVPVPAPGEGEVHVRNLWMSVDPYMRGRMRDERSYIAPFQIGEPLDGDAIGEVTVSNALGLQVGDLVESELGWRESFTAPATAVRKLDVRGLPPQAFLGVAGAPGLTAYAGLTRIAGLKGKDVVFVSGAAGAVGSLACQIAKARGHRVIGSAGGPKKVEYLRSIGVDHAIDYKAETDLTQAVRAGAPDGIDVYFDNVGGDHLEAALNVARGFARFALCGMISGYNNTEPSQGARNIAQAIGKSIRLEGYICTQHYDILDQFRNELVVLIQSGRVTWEETVLNGIELAPEAFVGLFTGKNIGKMLVKLS
jgi:NADPH-dependent curcumin reductase CurA